MTALARERSEDVQFDAERVVRFLLHRVRRPYELAVAPFIDKICAATGEPNPARALRRLVEEALPGLTYAEARLRSLILRMDFDDSLTAEEAARDASVSRRHLQRMRADAIRTIAYRLRSQLDLSAESMPAPVRLSREPLDALATLLPAARIVATPVWSARFRLEHEAFLLARERDDAPEMRAIARNLRRLAEEPSLVLALRYQAEADLRLGRFGQACAHLDRALALAFDKDDAREFAALTLLRAEAQFADGNTATAEELALGARRGLEKLSPEWIAAELLVARTRLAQGAAWEAPDRAAELAFESSGAVAVEIARAQHAAAAGKWTVARNLAESAMLRAKALELDGSVARSAAVISAACRACGDLEAETGFRGQALRALLQTQDYLIARGLFCDLACGASLKGPLLDVIYERACLLVPQTVNDDAQQASAVRTLIAEIVMRGIDRFRPRRLLDGAAARVRSVESAFASYAPPAAGALEEMLTLAVVALTGQRWWSGQHIVLREALAAMNEAFAGCRPAGLLVGFPAVIF